MTRIQKYSSIGAVVLVALWGTAKVQAFDPQQEPPGFGPMSIQSGQTARVAAFCIDRNSLGGFPPGPCDVAFSFRSIHGTTLGQTRLTLAPGTGGFFDLPVGPDAQCGKSILHIAVRGTRSGFEQVRDG